MEYGWINKQEYKISYIQETIEMIVYSAICFFIPFFLGHPQLLVGITVNAALVMAALNLRSQNLLQVIIMPSLGVLARGIVFGPLTIYLVYMIPFIWIGNAILVFAVKRLMKKKIIGMGIGAILKSGFLFGIAFALVSFEIIPTVFLTSMGIIQMITALSGGLIAIGAQRIKQIF